MANGWLARLPAIEGLQPKGRAVNLAKQRLPVQARHPQTHRKPHFLFKDFIASHAEANNLLQYAFVFTM